MRTLVDLADRVPFPPPSRLDALVGTLGDVAAVISIALSAAALYILLTPPPPALTTFGSLPLTPKIGLRAAALPLRVAVDNGR